MKIHLIGIGGIAMGNLASMLRSLGHEVSGSDSGVYPPMSDKLKEWGIPYAEGFDPSRLKGKDLVVIGNAISRGNPEVEEVLNEGLEYASMSSALERYILAGKKVVVVAGTHGKTTTTFLIHYLLKEAGLNPSLFVGGIRQDGFPGFEYSNGEYFIIEGDEYDTAFFDKASKFLHYRPLYAVLNALDFDHADIFKDIGEIETMFARLLRLVPGKGKVYYWAGAANLKKLCKDASKFLRSEAFEYNRKESVLSWKKGNLVSGHRVLRPRFFGDHNYRNAEVALRVCEEILKKEGKSDPRSLLLDALEKFPGVKRRQEILFESSKTIVIEDFAHHPVAVQETIKSVRKAFPDHKIISLFEPRSATSHRNVFQKEYSFAFNGSTVTFITEIFNLKKVSKENRLDVKKLILKLPKHSGTLPFYCKDPKDLILKLRKILPQFEGEKILILAMSNGAFGGIYPLLKDIAGSRK
ncbi:putative UDP-N-acetylmuramate:L-alanyl-gamma-D-glutamyl-meso-diaminopimelate ligase [Leptospira inadai serovar Lyme str. 10]|uniref:UDP-N-acetylmuramate--alanine ligase n=2 Tax=Leptospira inadai serovar Lyme TaxID=293084 RepID=A0ABX4YLD7_9LEPT|nr:Mur ligase domain-containing protein [Leptospira inadai]EQA34961.1 putative UDP-N-acetylmuramate:L-alanyl-gamma-D-glutamyl-meso-diaminopimelate ligase [Leptospira inadai serovar Lyme str. 10]PNV75975.1 UDP-N-acetylmuramate--alanine ligase [Leptospira inadai serovar Lyme]